MPLATALDDIPGLAVTDQEAAQLRLGQAILARGRVSLRAEAAVADGDAPGVPVYCRSRGGDPVAIGTFERGEIRPTRVFNFSH
jgi:tRNA pseudouridine55 synthase